MNTETHYPAYYARKGRLNRLRRAIRPVALATSLLLAGGSLTLADQRPSAAADVVMPAPVSRSLDGVDVARGTDKLVAYTSAGRPAGTTGTNSFGYEITVTDGRITAVGGNNNPIPTGSSIAARTYVLSGHGTADKFLSANATVGAVVEIAGNIVTISVDGQSYLLGANTLLTQASDAAASANASCLVYAADSASAKIAESQKFLESANAAGLSVAEVANIASQASDAAREAFYYTTESRPVEGRGIWVRPTETTPDAIRATLDKISATGFNMIFLETVFQGYTIYPSAVAASSGVTEQRPQFAGSDPLAVWISEAHARGIELHPWVHTFYVGADATGDGIGPVLRAHPEWAAVEREDVGKPGILPSSKEPGYYFIDPAHPDARKYVKDLYSEILSKYDVDGVHLDYIRYAVSEPWQTAGYSYSDFTRALFQSEKGVDPYTLTPSDAMWQTWTDWKIEKITSFVADIRAMQQQVKPSALISAAVFADPLDGLNKKFQNWGDWVDRGYVDVLTGMSFGADGTSVGNDTAIMRTRVGSELLYTATYGAFHGRTPSVVLDQITAVTQRGSDGAGVFSYNQLRDDQAHALALGPFRTPAITPHANPKKALLAGITHSLSTMKDATCGDAGNNAATVASFAAAERALRAGDAAAAKAAFQSIIDTNQAAADSPTGAFEARLVRDSNMYVRWLDRAVTIAADDIGGGGGGGGGGTGDAGGGGALVTPGGSEAAVPLAPATAVTSRKSLADTGANDWFGAAALAAVLLGLGAFVRTQKIVGMRVN